MRTVIDSSQGVVTEDTGSGVIIEGVQDSAFDLRWTDLFAQIREGTGASALTNEAYRDTGFFIRFFRHNQNDKIFMIYQFPHGWDDGPVRPHMHMLPAANANGNVVFETVHCWARINDPVGPALTWTTGSVTASLTTADTFVHRIQSFGELTPPSASMGSSALLFYGVERVGDSPNDTYTGSKASGTAAANLGILYFDLHMRFANAGTVGEFA